MGEYLRFTPVNACVDLESGSRLGREQLAGPRAPALDEELLRKPSPARGASLVAHVRRVYPIASELAPDEDAPAAQQQPAHRPELRFVRRRRRGAADPVVVADSSRRIM